ncbi:MAG: hypothetical protein HY305_03925 [Sphingobacteriales bacterium]|nr:hypothetical protein [Sphingobacteriales bacterium]
MVKTILAYTLVIIIFFISFLLLTRSLLGVENMNIVNGRILNKEIVCRYKARNTLSCALVFTIENLPYRIGISYNVSSKRKHIDSLNSLLKPLKIYKFYLDPTVGKADNTDLGIYRIDENSQPIYIRPKKHLLIQGIIALFVGIIFLIAVIINSKKASW